MNREDRKGLLLTPLQMGDALEKADMDKEKYYPCSNGDSIATIDVEPVCQAQLDKVLKEVQEIFEAYDKYVKGLEDENASIGGLAYVHGWRSNKVELGKQLREEIKTLKIRWSKVIISEVKE